MKNWRSITNKLTIMHALLSASILTLVAISAYWFMHQVIAQAEKLYLIDEIHIVQELLKKHPNDLSVLTQEVDAVPASLKEAIYHYYIRILDPNGKSVMQTSELTDHLPQLYFPELAQHKWESSTKNFITQDGTSFMTMSAPAAWDPQGNVRYWIQIAIDGSRPMNLLHSYGQKGLIVLMICILGLAWVGRQITKKGLKSLYNMALCTEEITVGQLSKRLEIEKCPTELVRLGTAFNNMLSRLEDGFTRISECTSELAHELRTPINNLRLATEIALSRSRNSHDYQQVLASNLEEFAKLSHLIDSVLFLARDEDQKNILMKSSINLEKELNALCHFHAIAANEKNIAINCAANGKISADITYFQRVLHNILSNAVKYTPPGGKIDITSQPCKSGIKIIVTDNGIGIPVEHLPFIFQRFHRVETDLSVKDGVGLGLAISKKIMDLHHGSMSVTSKVQQGTCVELIF